MFMTYKSSIATLIVTAVSGNLLLASSGASKAEPEADTRHQAYITDIGRNDLTRCDVGKNGVLNSCTEGVAKSSFSRPTDIALQMNKNGTSYIFVVDWKSSQITRCEIGAKGNLNNCANNVPENKFDHPTGITFYQPNNGQNYAYITNAGSNDLTRCELSDKNTLTNCKKKFALVSNFHTPRDIQFHSVENGKTRSYTTNNSKNFLSSCVVNDNGGLVHCSKMFSGGNFDGPTGLHFHDFDGGKSYIYVTNDGGDNITRCELDKNGKFHNCETGVSDGDLSNPYDIVFHKAGNNQLYGYILNGMGDTITRCELNKDSYLSNCQQSSVGKIFSQPSTIVFTDDN